MLVAPSRSRPVRRQPFRADDVHYVFSRRAPSSVPAGVQFVTEPIGAFAKRLRNGMGKNAFMMGGGELIASFLDAGEIDEFIINVIPTFIGEGIPLIAHRHREVPLLLQGVKPFRDGVVQLHYVVQKQSDADTIRGGCRRR